MLSLKKTPLTLSYLYCNFVSFRCSCFLIEGHKEKIIRAVIQGLSILVYMNIPLHLFLQIQNSGISLLSKKLPLWCTSSIMCTLGLCFIDAEDWILKDIWRVEYVLIFLVSSSIQCSILSEVFSRTDLRFDWYDLGPFILSSLNYFHFNYC